MKTILTYYKRQVHAFSLSLPAKVGERLLLLFLIFLGLVSCTKEDVQPEAEGVAVDFTLLGIGTEVAENGTTRAALTKDTRVCVAIYRHNDAGELSKEYFVNTKDYVVSDNNGTLRPLSGVELRLKAGSYNFYTIVPGSTNAYEALNIDASGSTPTVFVPQEKDFAVSLTTNQTVTKWSSTEGSSVKRKITLSQLVRKCAKMNFAIDIAEDVAPTITNTKITKVVLTLMPSGLTASGTTLDPGSGLNTWTLMESFVTDTENPRKASGGAVLLPKTNGTFNLSMQAQFNGMTSVTTQFPAASVPAMSFDSGKEYTFTIRLTKDNMGNTVAGLWVTVSKWVTSDQDHGLGGVPTGPIYTQLLGQWNNITWGDVSLGDVPMGPIITGVSGWWTNHYDNPHVGSDDPDSND